VPGVGKGLIRGGDGAENEASPPRNKNGQDGGGALAPPPYGKGGKGSGGGRTGPLPSWEGQDSGGEEDEDGDDHDGEGENNGSKGQEGDSWFPPGAPDATPVAHAVLPSRAGHMPGSMAFSVSSSLGPHRQNLGAATNNHQGETGQVQATKPARVPDGAGEVDCAASPKGMGAEQEKAPMPEPATSGKGRGEEEEERVERVEKWLLGLLDPPLTSRAAKQYAERFCDHGYDSVENILLFCTPLELEQVIKMKRGHLEQYKCAVFNEKRGRSGRGGGSKVPEEAGKKRKLG